MKIRIRSKEDKKYIASMQFFGSTNIVMSEFSIDEGSDLGGIPSVQIRVCPERDVAPTTGELRVAIPLFSFFAFGSLQIFLHFIRVLSAPFRHIL
jgi:hypothetical protein